MLGYSYQHARIEQELKNCADLLSSSSRSLFVQGYVMDQIFRQAWSASEAWAAPYYAGDYLTHGQQENPDLGF